MGFFSSDYQDLMFIPFVKCFLTGQGNPYQFYYDNDLLSSFPYPPAFRNQKVATTAGSSIGVSEMAFLIDVPVIFPAWSSVQRRIFRAWHQTAVM